MNGFLPKKEGLYDFGMLRVDSAFGRLDFSFKVSMGWEKSVLFYFNHFLFVLFSEN